MKQLEQAVSENMAQYDYF